jgi:hypothetical protein
MAIVVEQPPSRKRNTVAEKGGKSEGKAEERRRKQFARIRPLLKISISIDITAYSIFPIVLGTTVG